MPRRDHLHPISRVAQYERHSPLHHHGPLHHAGEESQSTRGGPVRLAFKAEALPRVSASKTSDHVGSEFRAIDDRH